MAEKKIKVKMLQSLIGGEGYRKGTLQHLDPQTATQWEKGGLCEIIQETKDAKQGNNIAKRGAGKPGGGKKSPKS